MKKMFMAVIALMMTISASAQFYIYCNDGNVIKVDSISMVAPDADESNTGKTNIENGYEYVDLGLSVKWATYNVGAKCPEDCGDYFAWGETEPKEYYDWSTYKWCNGSKTTMTKYCINSEYGTIDNKKELELSDDAAYANWGGNWRMPTTKEQDELREQCIWTWTTLNEVNGYNVTSKSNGNSIFLPAAGSLAEGGLEEAGIGFIGDYWSSSLGLSHIAYGLFFVSDDMRRNNYYRYLGKPIRPVCP